MVYAYVLVKAELGMQNDALTKIRKIKGVERVDTVTGPHDIIVLVRGEDLDALGKTVVSKIQNIGVVKDTMTCIVLDLL